MTFRTAPPLLGEDFAPALQRLTRGDGDAGKLLEGSGRGVEREALRMDGAGRIASSPHPQGALGSPLCHPGITTDFAEAQLELVTPVQPDAESLQLQLRDLHALVDAALEEAGEWMWPLSMPPPCSEDEPAIARYGPSHAGRVKELYREGLRLRYGARVQAISGVHYNLSFGEGLWRRRAELGLEPGGGEGRALRDGGYMGMVRNFLRWHWLLVWCTGASPVSCGPVQECCPSLGHSLRNGPCGYSWDCQPHIPIGYGDLAGHVADMERCLHQSWPQWAESWAPGAPNQLRPTLLQIPNEYYAPIRLKQEGDDLIGALRERGVGWVEIRCMDSNPFTPCGIDLAASRLAEMLLLWCALTPSPDFGQEEKERALHNLRCVALDGGGDPAVQLPDGGEAPLSQAVAALRDQLTPLAQALGPGWEQALSMLEGWRTTPSGKLHALAAGGMQAVRGRTPSIPSRGGDGQPAALTGGEDLVPLGRQLAEHNRQALQDYLDSFPVGEVLFAIAKFQAEASVQQARQMEQDSGGDFADYLGQRFPYEA